MQIILIKMKSRWRPMLDYKAAMGKNFVKQTIHPVLPQNVSATERNSPSLKHSVSPQIPSVCEKYILMSSLTMSTKRTYMLFGQY